MKTRIFTPSYFLLSKDFVIKVDKKLSVGRSRGDIILEDDVLLSSIHCELEIESMNFYVKDLDSTNGVFLNKEKIQPLVRVQFKTGDTLKIGTDEYVVYDNEDTVRELTKVNKRKNPRPESPYSFMNIVTFFYAPIWMRAIYVLVILAALASFFLNMHLDMPVPQELTFLTQLYNEQILLSGLKMIFIVWAICLIHSFALFLFFNRNPIRLFGSLIVFGLAIFYIVDFSDGPLGGIKRYIIERDAIQNLKFEDKAIVHLKNVVDHQDKITKAFKFSKKRLTEEQQGILRSDFDANISRINEEMIKIDKSKQIK